MKKDGDVRIESKDGKQSAVYEIRDGKLCHAWKRFGDAGSCSYRLSLLSPDFSFRETFRGNPENPFHVGVIGTTTTILFLMSEMQRHAKAAAMILSGAVALTGFLFALLRLPKIKQTSIMNLEDTYVLTVYHGDFDAEELAKFLAALQQAILKSGSSE